MESQSINNQSSQRSAADAVAEYERRRDARRDSAGLFTSREAWIANLRLAIFAAAAVLAWFWLARGEISGYWLFVPLIAFVLLVIFHERTIRSRRAFERAASFYEDAIARMGGSGGRARGERYRDPHHPYADDLDIFGDASLFQRMSIARTSFGERTLANWLLFPASPEVVARRQEALAELQPLLDEREALAVSAAELDSALDPEHLLQWAAEPPARFTAADRLIANTLAIAGAVSLLIAIVSLIVRAIALSEPETGSALLARWPFVQFGFIPLFAVIAAELLFVWRLRGDVERVTHGVERASADLDLMMLVLRHIEKHEAQAAALRTIRETIRSGETAASPAIARLRRLVELLDSARNQFFAVIAPILLWRTRIGINVDLWRRQHGKDIARWMEGVGEWEALSSIASFAWESPDLVLPEVVEGPPLFAATALGHPLIDRSHRVGNDVTLDANQPLIIISGSNMSGKSTLLRSVGINTVLALAGAPVCARSLRLSPFSIGASIRINDSLAAGQSRFYAEITRIRQVVDLASGDLPLLYLLDEVLHGTNSHDRRIGAEAIVVSLVNGGSLGLVTTHDLALANMVQTLGDRAVNAHFEDHIEDGRMTFDYKLRPGVVTRSNALELMRSVGLNV